MKKNVFWVLLTLCFGDVYAQTQNFKVLFAFDKDQMSQESKTALCDFRQTIKENIVKVELEGRTDFKGNDSYNQKLSEMRCANVKKTLVECGLSESIVGLKALGENSPVESNETDAGMQSNRSVSVVFYLETIKKDEVSALSTEVKKEEIWKPLAQLQPFLSQKISAAKGGIATFEGGTVFTVPPSAFVYKGTKKLVKGEVELFYREYRSLSEIVMSGLPMTYQNNVFQSSGMFEVYAKQDGKELEIAPNKDIEVEFVPTEQNEYNRIYTLDAASNTWVLQSKIGEPDAKGNYSVPVRPNIVQNQCFSDYINIANKIDTIAFFKKSLEYFRNCARDRKTPYMETGTFRKYTTYNETFFNDETYAKTTKLDKIDRAKNVKSQFVNSISIEFISKKSNKYYYIKIKDAVNECKELSAYNGYIWRVKKRNKSKVLDAQDFSRRTDYSEAGLKSVLKKKYRDIMITLNEASEFYTILLKPISGKNYFIEAFPVKVESDADALDVSDKNYNTLLDFRGINAALDPKDTLEFYAQLNKLVRPDTCAADFISYFKDNFKTMEIFYDSLILVYQNINKSEFQQLVNHFSQQCSKHLTGLTDAYPKGYNNSLTPEQIAEIKEKQEVARKTNQVLNRTKLKTLGPANWDSCYGKPGETLLVQYQGETGEAIKPLASQVIDYNVKSVIQCFDPNSILFVKKAKTAVLLATKDKFYFVNTSNFKKAFSNGGILIVEDVTDKMKTKSGVEDVIGM